MLMMVMEKPMQVIIVINEPRMSAGAFCATRVENKGESATTENPQTNKKTISAGSDSWVMNTGERRQQQPEMPKAVRAIFEAPNICDK